MAVSILFRPMTLVATLLTMKNFGVEPLLLVLMTFPGVQHTITRAAVRQSQGLGLQLPVQGALPIALGSKL
jgi:hypothetical protein